MSKSELKRMAVVDPFGIAEECDRLAKVAEKLHKELDELRLVAAAKAAEREKCVQKLLEEMSADDRMHVIHVYCVHCGTKQPTEGMPCQCWNDE
jgi:hypothetical protein